ncbi:MAG: hypothetical protein PHF73_05540, partial [Massilibacteroides sp.]|nr:hypothetical protein [Massilibacteroides sp.]
NEPGYGWRNGRNDVIYSSSIIHEVLPDKIRQNFFYTLLTKEKDGNNATKPLRKRKVLPEVFFNAGYSVTCALKHKVESHT